MAAAAAKAAGTPWWVRLHQKMPKESEEPGGSSGALISQWSFKSSGISLGTFLIFNDSINYSIFNLVGGLVGT